MHVCVCACVFACVFAREHVSAPVSVNVGTIMCVAEIKLNDMLEALPNRYSICGLSICILSL